MQHWIRNLNEKPLLKQVNILFKSLLFIVIPSVALHDLNGQTGAPLITNFPESNEIENECWAICQDEKNVMLFATHEGILTYDGAEWKIVGIPTLPYSLKKSPADDRIYIGGDNNFGYLEMDRKGNYSYISLSKDLSGFGIITGIYFGNQGVWFCSEQSMILYDPEELKFDLVLKTGADDPFAGMIISGDNTFVNKYETGLYKIGAGTLIRIPSCSVTRSSEILFSLPFDRTSVLVGRSDSRLLLFDGRKFSNYQVNDNGFIKKNLLTGGIMLGDTAYAFSTVEGGAVVINRNTGNVIFTINNQNELPDDEIFALGMDVSGGLWLSHQYGLSRADLSLPVRNYSVFPGLSGNLTYALKYGGELYVATSKGVYYLNEKRVYEEREEVPILNVPMQPVSDKPAPGENTLHPVSGFQQLTAEIATKSPEPVQPSRRKKILNRIFGKNQQKTGVTRTLPEYPVAESIPSEDKPVEVSPITDQKTKNERVQTLKSISYCFEKVGGLNEKCRQLVATPQGILAVTGKGLFSIANHKANQVITGRYINSVSRHPSQDRYYVAAENGYYDVKFRKGKFIAEQPDPSFRKEVLAVLADGKGSLWLDCFSDAYRAENIESRDIKYSSYNLPPGFPEEHTINRINDTVFLITESGIHYFNTDTNRFVRYRTPGAWRDIKSGNFIPLSNCSLVKTGDSWYSLNPEMQIQNHELMFLRIFDKITSVFVEMDALYITTQDNRLFVVNRNQYNNVNPALYVHIKSISNTKGMLFDITNAELGRGDDVVCFDVVAPVFVRQQTTQYQYYINKVMTDWSPWSPGMHYEKSVSKPGEYILEVRARDFLGNIGQSDFAMFTISAPFTHTFLFYFLIVLASLMIIAVIGYFRIRQLQIKNRILEEKVIERTSKIEAQKTEILSSIEYACRIQRALLPREDHFRDTFSDYFILFKPRDIVSGDFYWMSQNDKSVFFTVADCTGHGVPGAFMSTMGISTLNEIVVNNQNLQANTVLNLLREKTISALHQTGSDGEAADGMDIAFCVFEKETKTLQFSGAYNSIFIFHDGEFTEYRADRMPVGIYYGREDSFTNHFINVREGDTAYIFTDGFIGQFGGPEGKCRYKTSNFKKLLTGIHSLPMKEQHNILETEFATWMGSEDQVDDVTVIGIRF